MPYKDKGIKQKHYQEYYQDNKDFVKWNVHKYCYGITKEQAFDLLEKQDNKCALCNKPFTTMWGKGMHIDHCHETNKVRGILCMPCNVGLGMLGDNEEGLSKALAYVKGELV